MYASPLLIMPTAYSLNSSKRSEVYVTMSALICSRSNSDKRSGTHPNEKTIGGA